MPVILILMSKRQEDQEFKAGLGYLRPFLKETNKSNAGWWVDRHFVF